MVRINATKAIPATILIAAPFLCGELGELDGALVCAALIALIMRLFMDDNQRLLELSRGQLWPGQLMLTGHIVVGILAVALWQHELTIAADYVILVYAAVSSTILTVLIQRHRGNAEAAKRIPHEALLDTGDAALFSSSLIVAIVVAGGDPAFEIFMLGVSFALALRAHVAWAFRHG